MLQRVGSPYGGLPGAAQVLRDAALFGAPLATTLGAFIAMWRMRELMAALAVLAALGIATPAAADDVLVSNIDQLIAPDRHGDVGPRDAKQALGFTTGSHGTGYTLSSIDLRIEIEQAHDLTVQLATGLMAGAIATTYTVVATLSNPPNYTVGVGRFTAPTGTVLDANTKYWVVATAPKYGPGTCINCYIGFKRTWADGETGQLGWSVDDTRFWSGDSGRWASKSDIFMMRVNGTERTSSQPVLTISGDSAVTEGTAASFTVTSDRAPSEALAVNLIVSEPAGSDYVASSDEGAKTVTIPANATTATYSVATQANSAVEPHGAVTVRVATGTGYTVGTTSGASVAVHEATPQPLPVVGLTASYSGATAIGLVWALPTQPAGVTVTGLEVQQESGGSWTTVASLGANATSHTVTGLTNGESHTFRVRVAANHGTADSETVSMIALALPKPASGLTISMGTQGVDASWTLPEQGAGVVVSGVELHIGTHVIELAADATSVVGLHVLHGGRTYRFHVRVVTNTGFADSEVVSWSSLPAEAKPLTNLSFSNVTTNSVDLSWTLPEQGEGVVVNAVEVRWGEDGISWADSELATLAGDAVSHTVTGLSPSTEYTFLVQLRANTGWTMWVEEDQWTAAAVSGVAVVSDAGGDDTYRLGEAIRIRVSFTGRYPPDVYTSGGIPRLQIDMDGVAKWAAYEGNDWGRSNPTFAYTVEEPDISTQGIAVLANTLELNGGTIRARSRNVDLSHDGLDHDPAHKVDWQAGPETPAVTEVAVVSDAGRDDTYAFGEAIRVRLTFSDAVDVTGAPRLQIDMDPADWGEKWAAYESGSGTSELTFVHTVAEPNISTRGIAVLGDSLELNGGTIRSAATQADAGLGHAGLDHDPAHKVDWRPFVIRGSVSSRPAEGNTYEDTYETGETIRVRLRFSEAVNVTGAPRLTIYMGAGHKRWATYERRSGTALYFAYTVEESDLSRKGISVLADTLELNGGTMVGAGSGADAQLAHDLLNGHTGHKVNWKRRPFVPGLGLHKLPASGDTYGLGETIEVNVAFDLDVLVTGTPRLKIKMDPASGERWATYVRGSGGNFLTFAYTVVKPDISTQGIAVLADTLELNGGAIWSADHGTIAELSHEGRDHHPQRKVDWQQSAPVEELSMSVSHARAVEGELLEFTVSLSKVLANVDRVMVDYATSDGTAESGTDFRDTAGTLIFRGGRHSRGCTWCRCRVTPTRRTRRTRPSRWSCRTRRGPRWALRWRPAPSRTTAGRRR